MRSHGGGSAKQHRLRLVSLLACCSAIAALALAPSTRRAGVLGGVVLVAHGEAPASTSRGGRGWLCRRHPFEPKRLPRQQPFFNGWCLRTTDHGSLSSSSLILGSYSAAGTSNYTAHLIAVAARVRDDDGGREDGKTGGGGGRVYRATAQVLLPPEAAEVLLLPRTTSPGGGAGAGGGGGGVRGGGGGETGSHFSWSAPGVGWLRVRGDEVEYDFTLPLQGGGSIRTAATMTTTAAAPASSEGEQQQQQRRRQQAGVAFRPEGWLRRIGWLLPCRYHIASLGAPTPRRRLRIVDASGAVAVDIDDNDSDNENLDVDVGRAGEVAATSGSGGSGGGGGGGSEVTPATAATTHLEANWGNLFPRGWVWCQANENVATHEWKNDGQHPHRSHEGENSDTQKRQRLAEKQLRSLIVVGGRFRIGPLLVPTWVVAFASPAIAGRSRGGKGGEGPAPVRGGEERGEGVWAFRTTDVVTTKVRCASWEAPSLPASSAGAASPSLSLSSSTSSPPSSSAARSAEASQATLSLVLRSSLGRRRRSLRGRILSLLRPWRFFRQVEHDKHSSTSSSSTSSLFSSSSSLVARELEVEAATASGDFFNERLFVPTAGGFADDPGCVESFGATVRVRAYHCHRVNADNDATGGADTGTDSDADKPGKRGGEGGETTKKPEKERRELIDEAVFKNAALEFGGVFTAVAAAPAIDAQP